MSQAKRLTIGFWIFTLLFTLEMGFTAYAQLSMPQVAQAFVRMGFPRYFRVELAWAKLVGLAVLLLPTPPRLKEWAYAAFTIVLVSAIIAHLSIGEGFKSWGFAFVTLLLLAGSYYFSRRLEAVAKGTETA